MKEPPTRLEESARRLLRWYRREGRDLPWRRRPDAYRVWVSEIMLQQTTVAVAAPYFERLVARYPNVRALAAAREEDLLALWSGLGYYHRARNMLRAAKLIAQRHAGRVPADLASLRALPGVGPYTAGAILSIGYNLPFPAPDGNVLRVVARLGGLQGDPKSAGVRRAIEDLARRLIPPGEASAFNQALMDLGATICSPRSPDCGGCPASSGCVARLEGMVDRIPPPRAARGAVPVAMAALAVRRGGRVLLVRRGDGPLMKGMWEFPLVAASSPAALREAARRAGARLLGRAGQVRHTITRHRIQITVYEARPATGGRPAARARAARWGREAFAVSEPGSKLATPGGVKAVRWVALGRIVRPAASGLALTGAARKIARLLAG